MLYVGRREAVAPAGFTSSMARPPTRQPPQALGREAGRDHLADFCSRARGSGTKLFRAPAYIRKAMPQQTTVIGAALCIIHLDEAA